MSGEQRPVAHGANKRRRLDSEGVLPQPEQPEQPEAQEAQRDTDPWRNGMAKFMENHEARSI